MNASTHAPRLSIPELGRRFRDGTLSPETVIRDCLAAIAANNDTLGCFFRVTAEIALAQAKDAAARFAAGEDRGPLQGIPYALADVIDVAGIPTTSGSLLMRDHIPETSASVVRHLQAQGAVLIGKASIFEFAVGSPGADSAFPPARNPYDPSRTAGATGGGAAIACGMTAFAVTSDTGGAARGAAALCGVAGIKPTFGAIPCDGIFPAAPSLDHCGFMASSAQDIELVVNALMARNRAPRKPPQSVRELTVGVLSGFPGVQPMTEQALQRAARAFQSAGATVKVVSNGFIGDLLPAAHTIYAAECFAIHRRMLTATPDRYGSSTRHRVVAGAFVSPADEANARRLVRSIRKQLDDEVFSVCDLLLLPAAAGPAPPLESSSYGVAGRSGALTLPFNVTGHPAISVPCGTANGLPLGLQIVGRHHEEATVLLAAKSCPRTWTH